MRIAILSDIHGNVLALDAVLADIQRQGPPDLYWVLGDLIALGSDPVAVLERLRASQRSVHAGQQRSLCAGQRSARAQRERGRNGPSRRH